MFRLAVVLAAAAAAVASSPSGLEAQTEVERPVKAARAAAGDALAGLG